MSLFGGADPEKIARKAAKREEKRLAEAEERAAKRESFEVTEGQGIAERAQISLGNGLNDEEFDINDRQVGREGDDSADDIFLDTGLVI